MKDDQKKVNVDMLPDYLQILLKNREFVGKQISAVEATQEFCAWH